MFSRSIYNRINTLFKLPVNSIYSNNTIRLIGTKNNGQNTVKNTIKYSLIGASVGAFVGVGYFFHNSNNTKLHITQGEEIITLIKDVPKIEPSRRVSYKVFS